MPTQETKDSDELNKSTRGKRQETSAPTPERPRTVIETSPLKISIYKARPAWKKPSKSEAHARYHIFAYGCSRTIYKDVEKAKFAKMSGIYDVLDDHARQDKSLAAIGSMKLVWEPGADCCRWAASTNAKLRKNIVIVRDDDSNLEKGFGDDNLGTELQLRTLQEATETVGSDDDYGKDSGMGTEMVFPKSLGKNGRDDSL